MKSTAFVIFACVLLSAEWADAFGFGLLGGGGGGGCGGCAPPPPQMCMPKFSMPSLPSLPCPPPPCGCGRKKRGTEGEVAASSGPLLCTSEKLREILLENISASTTESKVNIQKALFHKLHSNFVVVCDKLDFEHVVKSKDFCQESAHDVTCYIYRPL